MGLGHPLFGGKKQARAPKYEISFGGIPNSRNVLFLQIFLKRDAKPSAGNTPAGLAWNRRKSCWTWPGSAPKPPRPSPEPCWTWPGSAPKPLRPSPEPSPDLLRNLLRNPVEPHLALHQSLPDLLRNLLRNLLENLDLALLCTKASWNLPRNLLRNPVEPDLALHQSLPNLLRNLLRNLFERDLALHQSPPDLLWNLRNLLRNLVEPVPPPAPVHTAAILGWRPH